MNYSTLNQQIQQYLQNDESTFVASIPDFVRLAERKIYDAAQLPVTRVNVTTTLNPGNPSIGVPSDFCSVYELSVTSGGSVSFLQFRDVSFIREMYPTSAQGAPRYYTLLDNQNILMGPTPDQAYPVELHYFGYPESIVTAGTTWLGDRFENALLYGSLLQGYTFMKGEGDMLGVYKTAYEEALAEVKMFSAGKSRGDTYREQFRVPVTR